MKMKRIAINGFGRIGRASLKVVFETPGLDIVAVNDLMDIENAAYLLQYDSVYGKYDQAVSTAEDHLQIGEHKVRYLSEKDPAKLPWKELNIDIVIESSIVIPQNISPLEVCSSAIQSAPPTVVIVKPVGTNRE